MNKILLLSFALTTTLNVFAQSKLTIPTEYTCEQAEGDQWISVGILKTKDADIYNIILVKNDDDDDSKNNIFEQESQKLIQGSDQIAFSTIYSHYGKAELVITNTAEGLKGFKSQ
jgi:hypothetical protein